MRQIFKKNLLKFFFSFFSFSHFSIFSKNTFKIFKNLLICFRVPIQNSSESFPNSEASPTRILKTLTPAPLHNRERIVQLPKNRKNSWCGGASLGGVSTALFSAGHMPKNRITHLSDNRKCLE